MFSSISWSAYLTFIAVSALFYYAFVLYTYYRHDLVLKLKGKQALAHSVHFTADVSMQSTVPAAINHEDYQPKSEEVIAQSFSDGAQAYLEEAGQNEIAKDVLLQCLSVIAGKYPSLVLSAYKESIEELIIKQAAMNCAVSLSENEVRSIWNRT